MDLASVLPERAGRLLYQLPNESRVMRAIQPANHWGWPEILLNKIGFVLEVLAWQNTQDAAEGRTGSAPELWQPDFIRNAINAQNMDPNAVVRTTDEIAEILARPRT